MTQDEIIEMAKQAGVSIRSNWAEQELEAFAKLVAEKEREACAKLCDELGEKGYVAEGCAKEIRARGLND